MNKVVFIADFFVEHILGGGELNNDELIKMLSNAACIQSHQATPEYLLSNSESKFIVANFANLSENAKAIFSKKLEYVIYEHDHKYLKGRDPSLYPSFVATEKDILNRDFYTSAKAVLCQSEFHKNIVYQNLKIDNIVSLGGNLWSLDTLDLLASYAKKKKNLRCSIMKSPIPHKNTQKAMMFCKLKELPYDLIPPCDYHHFLDLLSNNDTFVFFPGTPETLSRVVVEARMMGMKTITNSSIGATREDWFHLKGLELIDLMREKREEIKNTVCSHLLG